MLVQQLAGLSQTAEVWQGQVAQYQLDELWTGDGERGSGYEGTGKGNTLKGKGQSMFVLRYQIENC